MGLRLFLEGMTGSGRGLEGTYSEEVGKLNMLVK